MQPTGGGGGGGGCRLRDSLSYHDALTCLFARLHRVWRTGFAFWMANPQNGTAVQTRRWPNQRNGRSLGPPEDGGMPHPVDLVDVVSLSTAIAFLDRIEICHIRNPELQPTLVVGCKILCRLRQAWFDTPDGCAQPREHRVAREPGGPVELARQLTGYRRSDRPPDRQPLRESNTQRSRCGCPVPRLGCSP